MRLSMLLAKPVAALVCAFSLLPALHAAGPALTEAKAKELIQSTTRVRACADGVYSFRTVQVAAARHPRAHGLTAEVYPVHAAYAVTCRYGDEQMRAEVDLTAAVYRDEFGGWKMQWTGDAYDQNWDNTQGDVRCRVQNLAHLTLDASGKVTGSTPAKDTGYIGCLVETKAAE